MQRAKWYRVTKKARHGLRASTAIEGIRDFDVVAPPDMIVPGEWFRDVADDLMQIITYEPPRGRGAAVPVDPDRDEYLVLYTMYPAMTPSREIGVADAAYRSNWWRVRWSFCGLQALTAMDGICEAGEIAENGAIIPRDWFAALNNEQFSRLIGWGMIERYRPDPLELDGLLERYPGLDDNLKTEEG